MNQQTYMSLVGVGSILGFLILYTLLQAIVIRVTIKDRFFAYFLEKHGQLTPETVKIQTFKSGQFFKDQMGGLYRIDSQRQFRTGWPKSAPSFIQEPIMASFYTRNEPEPVAIGVKSLKLRGRITEEEAENYDEEGNGDPLDLRGRTPESFMTALMIAKVGDENVAKLIVQKAEQQVGDKRRNDMLGVILAGLTFLAVVGTGVMNYRSDEAINKSLDLLINALGIERPVK